MIQYIPSLTSLTADTCSKEVREVDVEPEVGYEIHALTCDTQHQVHICTRCWID